MSNELIELRETIIKWSIEKGEYAILSNVERSLEEVIYKEKFLVDSFKELNNQEKKEIILMIYEIPILQSKIKQSILICLMNALEIKTQEEYMSLTEKIEYVFEPIKSQIIIRTEKERDLDILKSLCKIFFLNTGIGLFFLFYYLKTKNFSIRILSLLIVLLSIMIVIFSIIGLLFFTKAIFKRTQE